MPSLFTLCVQLISMCGFYTESKHFYPPLQQNKGKKKKKGVLPGGGLKAQLKDDLDYAAFDGGYTQDYEDFM